jgi:hypothetical protein
MKTQIVKFHTPLEDENPDQLYLLIQAFDNRAEILALSTGLRFPPINTVTMNDLEVVDIIGKQMTISKSDYSEVTGKVIRTEESEVSINLGRGVKGTKLQLWVTVEDENKLEHTGLLI